LVRFFGKPRKTATSRASARTSPSPEPVEPVKLEALPTPETPPDGDAPKTRRRTTRTTRTTRPPRRDWAAEAALTPAGEPLPAPASLAVGEEIDPEAPAGAPAKRRRGTRGGRGRKKNGHEATEPLPPTAIAVPAPTPVREKRRAAPTLEEAIEHQAAAIEALTRELSATLKSVQTQISDIERRIEQQPETAISPRVGIFVDVPNVIYAAERRGVALDFGKVLAYFTRGRELVRATAYAPISDDPSAKLESQRFAHHFIGHAYRLVTKPLKRFADGSMKANFDIELAVDILTMSDRLDVVVLMSGDGDFRRVVELVASRGVRVEVAAFSETAAMELKSVADLYIDLADHIKEFKTGK